MIIVRCKVTNVRLILSNANYIMPRDIGGIFAYYGDSRRYYISQYTVEAFDHAVMRGGNIIVDVDSIEDCSMER